MQTQANYSNPCIRCGKQRKLIKEWTENNVTYSTWECEDDKCQELVNKTNLEREEKYRKVQEAKIRRTNLRFRKS